MLSLMERVAMENELVPDNSNVVKKKKKRNGTKKSSKKVDGSSKDAQYLTFSTIDPCRDSPSFVKFYRYVVSASKKEAKFDMFDSDVRSAASVLDVLIEGGVNNKEFLTDWIEYFVLQKLRGNKFKWVKYTSVSAFGKTYEEYRKKRVLPNQIV